MKKTINLINKLEESNIIDFTEARNKQDLEKLSLDFIEDSDGESIIRTLRDISTNALNTARHIKINKTYDSKYMTDLYSLASELLTLYEDMLKED